MRIVLFFIFNLFTNVKSYTNIINNSKQNDNKPCIECKHFVKQYAFEKYYIGNYYGQCNKFKEKDKLTLETIPIFALDARVSEKYCGKKGKYFEKITEI
jgi:hypothetical protein